jgi:hypothetical protein
MKCRMCGKEMSMVPCPDKRPGCLVAHYQCKSWWCMVRRFFW